jgi:capsular polysaccharide biosynthesis protein/Mrp family chromosome partitioning ATPase
MTVYLRILQRRWLILVVSIVASALVSFLLVSRQGTSYSAQAKLRIVPFGIGRPDSGTYLYFEQVANTLMALLKTDAIVNEAKEKLNTEKLSAYEVGLIPRTELLQITVTDKDPEIARDTANLLGTILVERLRSQYVDSVSGIEKTFYGRLRELETEITSLNHEQSLLLNAIPRDEARLSELTNLLDRRSDEYQLLLSSYNQILIAQATQSNVVSIIEPAILPAHSNPRQLALAIIVAIGLGGFAGIMIIFTLEILNARIYTDDQLHSLAPDSRVSEISLKTARGSKASWQLEASAFEAVRRIRAQLQPVLTPQPQRFVGVTGLDHTTQSAMIALQLARAFAEIGQQTLLLDTEVQQPLRRPFAELYSDAEAGTLVPTTIPCLALLMTGQHAENQVLAGRPDALAYIAEQLPEPQDQIVLHAAAFTERADTLALVMQLKQIILVIPRGAEKYKVVAILEELAKLKTEVLNIVIHP